MKKKKSNFDLDYLRRCKYSSPESKLEWLEAAVDFTYNIKKPVRKIAFKKL